MKRRTDRSAGARRLLTLLALLSAPVLVTAVASSPAPAAAKNDTKPIRAQLVYEKRELLVPCPNCGPGGTPTENLTCSFAIFVEFPKVKRATSYVVSVRDGAGTRTFTGDQFADDVDPAPYKGHYKAPAGHHRFGGLTGGSGPAENCVGDPTYNGRFEVLKALAICPGKCGKTSKLPGTGPTAPAPKVPPLPPAAKPTARALKASSTGITVVRNGATYTLSDGATLQTGDIIRTGPGATAGLEFLIGGRVTISPNSEVQLLNERSVGGDRHPVINTVRGAVDAILPVGDVAPPPIEIQTNGGVLGVHG